MASQRYGRPEGLAGNVLYVGQMQAISVLVDALQDYWKISQSEVCGSASRVNSISHGIRCTTPYVCTACGRSLHWSKIEYEGSGIVCPQLGRGAPDQHPCLRRPRQSRLLKGMMFPSVMIAQIPSCRAVKVLL